MKIGSLFSGVAGLDRAVESFFDAQVAWFVEFDKAPSKVLAYHYPNVPNYGDVTTVDWANVEPVDIITGGSPCQDLSAAGKRKGMTDGTRSNLWAQMREAIATLKPRYVVWENVRGAYSARANSEVESEPGLLGEFGQSRPALRALGRVLGDLSELGYDAEWVGLRAADAGAPHNRFRVFVIAYPHGVGLEWSGEARKRGLGSRDDNQPASDASSDGFGGCAERNSEPQQPELEAPQWIHADGRVTSNSDHPGRSEQWGAVAVQPEHAPTEHRSAGDWGAYSPAIERWEAVTGRPAPSPTRPDGRDGGHRLNPELTEWMMGWPDGWLTDPAIGLTRNEQLKACGNGVVTQQAYLALQTMAGRTR